MQKISVIEGERVLAVLSEAIENTEILTRIPVRRSDEFLSFLGEHGMHDLVGKLNHQWQLEETCSLSPDGMGVGAATSITLSALEAATKQLKSACRSICREIKQRPEAIQALFTKPDHFAPPDHVAQLLDNLAVLKDVTYNRLAITKEEAEARHSQEDALVVKHDEMAKDKEILLQELNDSRTDQAHFMSDVDSQLHRLHSHIDSVKGQFNTQIAALNSTTTAQRQTGDEAHSDRTLELYKAVETATAEMKELKRVHRDAELHQRKLKDRMLEAIRVAQAEYDTQMSALQEDEDALTAQYEEDKRNLEALREHFRIMDAEKERAKEEDRKHAEEKRAAHLTEMKILGMHAAVIQARWRGARVRGQLAETNAARGKGKGKGKGKKGKK